MQTEILSKLYCPFPSRMSSHVLRAQEQSLAWCRSWRLTNSDETVAMYDSYELAHLMARTYPDAHEEDLALLSDLDHWFFIFDDQFDGDRGVQSATTQRAIKPFVELLQGNSRVDSSKEGPLVASFADLWHRSCAGMSSDWQARHAKSWLAYFTSYRREADVAASGDLPSVDDYLEYRRRSIGMYPCFDLIERIGRCELRVDVAMGPTMKVLRGLVAEHVTLVNDLFSAQKEIAAGTVHNMVLILRQTLGYTLSQAQDSVCEQLNRRVESFERITRHVSTQQDLMALPVSTYANINRVVDGMRSWLRGNLDWHARTPRYRDGGISYERRISQIECLLDE